MLHTHTTHNCTGFNWVSGSWLENMLRSHRSSEVTGRYLESVGSRSADDLRTSSMILLLARGLGSTLNSMN